MKKWISLLAVAALSTATYADIDFDNFENDLSYAGDGKTNSSNQTDLGATFNNYVSASEKYYEAGYWYAYDDSDDGGTSSASPDYLEDDQFESGLDSDGYEGSCLHLEITLGEGTDQYETAFYGIGANITETGQYHDFSALTSVDFYAKGTGDMGCKLLTKVSSGYAWGDMVSNFSLESDWKSYSLKASSFVPEPYSPTESDKVTWDDCKSQVEKLHFQTWGETMKSGEKISFYVDNIVLKGLAEGSVGPSAVKEVKATATAVELADAYPNPFNPVTTINFALPTAEKVSLKVFDAAGNLVNTLYNGVSAGQSVNWNATNMNGAKVASGVYFYRLTTASNVVTKKMVLLK
jgi:hypothetical protein